MLGGCFLGGWFEVPHVYGSDFHLWVYHIYTTSCIYLLKNLNRTLFFKKKRFYFITYLFLFTESSLRIRRNGPVKRYYINSADNGGCRRLSKM